MSRMLPLKPILSGKVRQAGERQRLRRFLLLACLGLSALLATGVRYGAPAALARQHRQAPVLNERAPNVIPGQYIVVFEKGTTREFVRAAQDTVKKLGGTVGFTYTAALIGFSAKLPANALQVLRSMPRVAYIEADQEGTLATIELNPPTGLDRTSERLLPLNNRYTYSETGTGVNVYVLDTGIRATHTDFGGRVSGGVDEIMDGNGTNDCHGHGTHVSGTIGGVTYGIAKQVALHPVRVATCTGGVPSSAAIAGVDWVTMNAVHPAVANMSLQFTGGSTSLDTAVTNSIGSGVVYVVAAGNSNTDACIGSPSRVPAAITVGAIDPTNDTRASFSNFGTCVDLFAPGVNILSDWNTNDTATNTISGTSQATPHVAGVAVRYLQNHPTATPAAVLSAIHNADDVSTTPGWGA